MYLSLDVKKNAMNKCFRQWKQITINSDAIFVHYVYNKLSRRVLLKNSDLLEQQNLSDFLFKKNK